ncbi:DUF3467 domain-containing protein [Patescibacteria group bacterium]|nr:DUF3467 domain-containing protein [Patescibacteria group bacterium]MBU1922050.1 DUF3467 domain-containing protein [Patescibacteria group bacterium]
MQYNPQPQQKQVQLKASEDVLKGRYSNMAQIAHAKEEFILDFMCMMPPQAQLVSRIVLSPGHAKRMMRALQENIEKYEGAFGKIEEAAAPKEIGFQG